MHYNQFVEKLALIAEQLPLLLSLYSLERRRELFLAIYIWKILTEMTPMILGDNGPDVVTTYSERRRRFCAVAKMNCRAPAPVRRILNQSLPIHGAKIFNVLPRHLREYTGSLASFKSGLDRHLSVLPDRPYLPHYYLEVQSNSLVASQ